MKTFPAFRWPISLSLLTIMVLMPLSTLRAQDPVTGAIEGYVFDSASKAPLAGALVQFINTESGAVLAKRTNSQGHYTQGLLPPGEYRIRVSMSPGYVTPPDKLFTNFATRSNTVMPPVYLVREAPAVATATPTAGQPAASPTPAPTTPATTSATTESSSIVGEMNLTDARHSGAYTDREVSTLPLGGTTLTRSFDELALLLPGIAPPPETQGSVAGPGVGAGVGSAGQFAVNGLRSRANNFTVDGSDNNDEDIGVRRQGFLSLVPQTIESIKEYQVISLLAPAQYGRNIGAQVNAVSKSGGKEVHGTLYGFFNSSQLNSRNFFDTTNGNGIFPLRAGNNQAVLLNGSPILVRNQSGGEDSLTLGNFGGVVGGPIVPDRMFFFISAERQVLNATKELSFAVPTVDQRGLAGSGATGLFKTPLVGFSSTAPAGSDTLAFPTRASGDAIFSLIPFPNNPGGVYGANTFTQVLPASGRGLVLSGKVDDNFKLRNRPQALAARYNLTNDWRDIPAVGEAIFSSLRPKVRTQNISTFLNSELSGADSTRPVFNQLRLSYGRTRLNFDELRDPSLLPSVGFLEQTFRSFGLLNARYIRNLTLPNAIGVANTGPVVYRSGTANLGCAANCDTVEQVLNGPVGQIKIAGFSPVGLDVFNFPQRRVNNTYQLADTLSWQAGTQNLAVGLDLRRTELNSDLPRNSRPLITVNSAPSLIFNSTTNTFAMTNKFISPISLAAAGAVSGFSQSVVLPGNDSHIDLRYYQWNFFGQDEWRVRPNLSLSFGLRYEYNTPPREVSGKIEKTFGIPELDVVPGLSSFIEGRTTIYDPDRNNFAPRLGVAYTPNFGSSNSTTIRAGYGIYFDQIPGAVVSQSRNVFPTFLTFNIPGGPVNTGFLSGANTFPFGVFDLIDPVGEVIPGHHHVQVGTLNVLAGLGIHGITTLRDLLTHHVAAANFIASGCTEVRTSNCPPLPLASGFGTTLPTRNLQMPMAHQFAVTVEQKLSRDAVLSVAYVGTRGRNLLRFTTPNLGQDSVLAPLAFFILNPADPQPTLLGVALPPGIRVVNGQLAGGRPVATVGTVNRFETTARSNYDALQILLRGRFSKSFQYQAAYTLSRANDDVSDVFDLAGASALPQDSLTLAGEYGPANFDARHRFSYNFIYDLPKFSHHGSALRFFFGALQVAGTGSFQSGQPFTVNSIFDVNLDGNLTDRLNNTTGINITGDRRQPLQLTGDPSALLAPIGQDGSVGRNTFRAGNLLDLDVSLIKNFKFSEQRVLALRMDVFNFINRANFGIPVRFLEAPGFGKATDTVTPGRRIQFALKFAF